MSDLGFCKHDMKLDVCDFCSPRTPRRTLVPASEITARFAARFDSDCDHCGDRMYESDPICRTRDGDYVHEDCTEQWPDLDGAG